MGIAALNPSYTLSPLSWRDPTVGHEQVAGPNERKPQVRGRMQHGFGSVTAATEVIYIDNSKPFAKIASWNS